MTADVATLRAGPLTADLADGMLDRVRAGGTVLLDSVYVAVRDADWGTVPACVTALEVTRTRDGFTAGYTAEHDDGEIRFRWRATITAGAGRLTFAMDGVPLRTFRANRIGFCLLHPQDLAGTPVEVDTPTGPLVSRFPVRISPHQPFPELTGMTYRTGRATLNVRLAGDLFETEDQRNWTDASFKTYCTPLRLGFPRVFHAGEPVRQTVTLTVAGDGTACRGRPAAGRVRVSVGTGSTGRMPGIGFALASQGGPLTGDEAGAVRACRPDHLHTEADLTDAGWQARLTRAAGDARALGAPLHVEAVCATADDLVPFIPRLAAARVRRLQVFDASTSTTTREHARLARTLLREAGLGHIELGGGSRANFAELNRADLPLDDLDVVTYAISPQVHAFDDGSVMSTLRAQPATVADARRIAGERPLAVGPITLRPRFNPVATGPRTAPAAGALPSEVDPRQTRWFTAAWAVGALAALASADSVTIFETAGWRGLLARADPALAHPLVPYAPGRLFPVQAVLRAISGRRGRPVLATTTRHDDHRVATLAVASFCGGVDAVVANLTADPVEVAVDFAGRPAARAVLLDGRVPADPEVVHLPPYRVAILKTAPATIARSPR